MNVCISEIEDTKFYCKAELSNIKIADGRGFVEALTNHIMAPEKTCPPKKYGNHWWRGDVLKNFYSSLTRDLNIPLAEEKIISMIADLQLKKESLKNFEKTIEEIISPVQHVNRNLVAGSGIYFLMKDYKVVYIGKSKNLFSRIGNHISDDSKQFDDIKMVPCSEADMNWLEATFIDIIRPNLNKQIPAPSSAIHCFIGG